MITEVISSAPEPSAEQVHDALRQLMAQPPVREPGMVVATAPPEPEPTVEAVPETVAETAPAPTAEQSPATDDVESLRARMEAYESRMEQVSRSLQWARDQSLRKGSELERAKAMLAKIQAGEDVDRGQLSALTAPISETAGYAPSNPFAPSAAIPQGNEVAAIDVQRFLIDNRMDQAAADTFVTWLQNPTNGLTEDDAVPGDVYKSLRLAKIRFDETKDTQNAVLATAARTVAATQRATARAASTVVANSRPATAPTPVKPVTEMTTAEMEKAGYVQWALEQLAGQR